MNFEKLGDVPIPVWLHVDAGLSSHRAPLHESHLWQLDPRLLHCEYRGVSIDRLATVLATGIDVEPSDAVIYAADFEKAWEYGGFPKVILALEPAGLDRTFRNLPATTPVEELEEVTRHFPNLLAADDGQMLWFSRIPIDDPHYASAYETAYARWIPGVALETLVAVFVFDRGSPADTVA